MLLRDLIELHVHSMSLDIIRLVNKYAILASFKYVNVYLDPCPFIHENHNKFSDEYGTYVLQRTIPRLIDCTCNSIRPRNNIWSTALVAQVPVVILGSIIRVFHKRTSSLMVHNMPQDIYV